jgi:cyclophilin family peptidyl-prolyl cis-trans isomerase
MLLIVLFCCESQTAALFQNNYSSFKRVENMCSMLVGSTRRLTGLALYIVAIFIVPSVALCAINVRMQTDLGGIDVLLRDDLAPLTVENYLAYMNEGAYDGTFIHRNIPGFVVQGGGYKFNSADGDFFSGGASHIPENPPVMNEAGLPGALSNIRGTIAMAKTPGDPDSAKSEWFINTVDNSANLDNQNGGFTVFAEVTGNGMDVVDYMETQDVCTDIIGLGFLCQPPFTDTIFAGASQVSFLDTSKLVYVQYIDVDTDGDGVVDRSEDKSPNGGDGNNDGTADSQQQSVASFGTISGAFATVETQPGVIMSNSHVMGMPFVTSTEPDAFIQSLNFLENQFGTTLTGLAPGGAVTATITFTANIVPGTFYAYGPTPNDVAPHWYEFIFDGETGAEINGNVITWHFVDGKRGDADLQVDGSILVSPGGPVIAPGDHDGIADDIEDAGPNTGDGNSDGVADSTQSYVASMLDINGVYVTVEADPALSLESLEFTNGAGLFTPENIPVFLEGFNLTHGVLAFEVTGLNPGDTTVVKLYLPSGVDPKAYFKFGPTPENAVAHWYEFNFDGETGAVFNGNIVELHFVDGKRGDSDLTANGEIIDPGAPAVKTGNAGGGGGGGGGCSLSLPEAEVHTRKAGAWWLLIAMLVLMRMHKKVSARLVSD